MDKAGTATGEAQVRAYNLKAMILAAGLGTRLRPLTDTVPKPMLSVAGKPLLEHHLEKLAGLGVTEVIINTFWLAEQIEEYVADGSRFGLRVQWSRESELLETGGGIRRALPLIGSAPFLLINGDVWCDYPLSKLCQSGLDASLDAHLVLVKNPQHNAQGDFSISGNNKVSYSKNAADNTYTFSGISLLRPELFSSFQSKSEAFPLRDVLRPSIEAGRVSGELYVGQWWDVGTVERYHQLNQYLSGAIR